MGEVGDAFSEARREVSEMAGDILPRVGALSVPAGATKDDYGEQVAGTPTEIDNIACSIKALSAFERAGATGTLAGSDHLLELPFFIEGVLLAVPADATFTVQADDSNPAQTFRIKGPMPDSEDLWQRVAATLV